MYIFKLFYQIWVKCIKFQRYHQYGRSEACSTHPKCLYFVPYFCLFLRRLYTKFPSTSIMEFKATSSVNFSCDLYTVKIIMWKITTEKNSHRFGAACNEIKRKMTAKNCATTWAVKNVSMIRHLIKATVLKLRNKSLQNFIYLF